MDLSVTVCEIAVYCHYPHDTIRLTEVEKSICSEVNLMCFFLFHNSEEKIKEREKKWREEELEEEYDELDGIEDADY